MRNKFEQELSELHEHLIYMGELCEIAICKATAILLKNESCKAKTVYDVESEIDAIEKEIENLCLRLLLQQQPVAKDLREISAALKIITDMERIGDQAADIAEIITNDTAYNHFELSKIGAMSKCVMAMVSDCVTAYVKRDLALTQAIIKKDDLVDSLFEEVKHELILFINKNIAEQGKLAIDLIMVAKYLERIGDHATNIAEWVEFALTGNHKSYSMKE